MHARMYACARARARRSTIGAAAALLCAAALLSWFFSVCRSMAAADALFNAAHVAAALGVGACAHLSWDIMLAATGALPGAHE